MVEKKKAKIFPQSINRPFSRGSQIRDPNICKYKSSILLQYRSFFFAWFLLDGGRRIYFFLEMQFWVNRKNT
jgi:hypothetical protein